MNYRFTFKLLSNLTGQKIVLPFYHNVSDHPLAHIKYLYNIRSVDHFEKDLTTFLRHFKPIAAEDLTKQLPDSLAGFHLSFDDGFAENYTVVAPILKKYGVPASFFISSGFIDNKDLMFRCKASVLVDQLHKKKDQKPLLTELAKLLLCTNFIEDIQNSILRINYSQRHVLHILAQIMDLSFEEYLKKEQPYMTSNQVKELSEMGFTIGSHSIDHPYYATIDLKEQVHQTKQSLEILHSLIDQKLKLFSFPFGDDGVKLSFFGEIQKEICPPIKLTFGTAGLKNDPVPNHFHRISMEKYAGGTTNIMLMQYAKYMLKAPFFRNRMKRNL